MSEIMPLKSPKTYEVQIRNLQERHGLMIDDPVKAKEILK